MQNIWLNTGKTLDRLLGDWASQGGRICAIAAIDDDGLIGYGDKLAYSMAKDMAYFSRTTKRRQFANALPNLVLVGRNTAGQIQNHPWLSYAKQSEQSALDNQVTAMLPGRAALVASDGSVYMENRVSYGYEHGDYIGKASGRIGPTLWIAGGQSIYEQTLSYCDEAHLTKIIAPTGRPCLTEKPSYFPMAKLHDQFDLDMTGQVQTDYCRTTKQRLSLWQEVWTKRKCL